MDDKEMSTADTAQKDLQNGIKMGKDAARTAKTMGKAAAHAATGDFVGAAAEILKDPETMKKIISIILVPVIFLSVVMIFFLYALPTVIMDAVVSFFEEIKQTGDIDYYSSDQGILSGFSYIFAPFKVVGGKIADIASDVGTAISEAVTNLWNTITGATVDDSGYVDDGLGNGTDEDNAAGLYVTQWEDAERTVLDEKLQYCVDKVTKRQDSIQSAIESWWSGGTQKISKTIKDALFDTYVIIGVAQREDGSTIPNGKVTVTISGTNKTVETDGTGFYKFDFITPSSSGYTAKYYDEHDTLVRTTTVYSTTYDNSIHDEITSRFADGSLAGLTATLNKYNYETDSWVAVATTDVKNDSSFVFLNLSEGRYKVTCATSVTDEYEIRYVAGIADEIRDPVLSISKSTTTKSTAVQLLALYTAQTGASVENIDTTTLLRYLGWNGSESFGRQVTINLYGADYTTDSWAGDFLPQYLYEQKQQEIALYDDPSTEEIETKTDFSKYSCALVDLMISISYPSLEQLKNSITITSETRYFEVDENKLSTVNTEDDTDEELIGQDINSWEDSTEDRDTVNHMTLGTWEKSYTYRLGNFTESDETEIQKAIDYVTDTDESAVGSSEFTYYPSKWGGVVKDEDYGFYFQNSSRSISRCYFSLSDTSNFGYNSEKDLFYNRETGLYYKASVSDWRYYDDEGMWRYVGSIGNLQNIFVNFNSWSTWTYDEEGHLVSADADLSVLSDDDLKVTVITECYPSEYTIATVFVNMQIGARSPSSIAEIVGLWDGKLETIAIA